MLAIEAGDATVIASGLAALAAVLVAIIGLGGQLRALRRENRDDHGETVEKVREVLANQHELRRDVSHIRTEVSEIHGTIHGMRQVDRDAEQRISRLEDHARHEALAEDEDAQAG